MKNNFVHKYQILVIQSLVDAITQFVTIRFTDNSLKEGSGCQFTYSNKLRRERAPSSTRSCFFHIVSTSASALLSLSLPLCARTLSFSNQPTRAYTRIPVIITHKFTLAGREERPKRKVHPTFFFSPFSVSYQNFRDRSSKVIHEYSRERFPRRIHGSGRPVAERFRGTPSFRENSFRGIRSSKCIREKKKRRKGKKKRNGSHDGRGRGMKRLAFRHAAMIDTTASQLASSTYIREVQRIFAG